MELKKCPKCGKIDIDNYGFCIKCGAEFTDEYPHQKIIIQDTLFQKMENTQNNNFNSNIDQKPKKRYTLFIILGYIFAILGGLIGLIIALYLATRKDRRAKKHGLIQLGILVFYVIIILLAIGTGVIDTNTLSHMLTNPTLFNYTSFLQK